MAALLLAAEKKHLQSDKQLEKISSYVKATNGFNGHNVRFAFSIDEVLAKMKAGEDLDFASFPAYNSLKENLTPRHRTDVWC